MSNEAEIQRFIDYKNQTAHLHHGTGRVFWQRRVKYAGRGKNKKKIGYRHHGQAIGKSWFYAYPKTIAAALELPDSETYSGHSVCHTGATIIADNGATVMELQKYGNWKSPTVAKRYNGESMKSKKKFASVFANVSSENGDNEANADSNLHNKNRKRSFTETVSESDNECVDEQSDLIENQDDDRLPLKRRKLSSDTAIKREFRNCTFTNCTIKF